MNGPQNIGQLSHALVTDGTTLTRNLEVLSKRGLIEDARYHEDERVRIVKTSPQGEAIYRQALPLWQTTQQEMLDVFGRERWADLADMLQLVETS